jgi:hypothetical protein
MAKLVRYQSFYAENMRQGITRTVQVVYTLCGYNQK